MNEHDRIAQLELALARLSARAELEEVMAQYQKLLSSGRIAEIPGALFARETPEPAIEYGASGQYIGFEKLSTFFEKDVLPGYFQIAALGSPSITVEGDGLHATGEWTALATELDAGTLGTAPSEVFEQQQLYSSESGGACYRAEWVWQRYRVQFVCEHGVWKIHRLQVLDLLRSPMDSDFVRFATERWATDGVRLDRLFTSNIPFAPGELPENNANGPTTQHWQYRTDALPPDFF